MIWSIPALQDTTIYEKDPYRNAGLDQILELRKEGDTTTSDLTESRVLMKFDISELSTILSQNGISINNISASLKLYVAQEYELPASYTLEARTDVANNSTGTATQLFLRVTLADSYVDPDVASGASFPPGDTVNGTLTLAVSELKAAGSLQPSGSFVITSPSYSLSAITGS